jgi:periplasmic protein TonB
MAPRRNAPAPAPRPEAAPLAPAAAAAPNSAPAEPVAGAPEPARRAPGVPARPAYARNPAPEYPASARRRRQQGLVLLEVAVTAEGRAARVALLHSSGVPALDEAALGAVRGWQFEPARSDGLAVACGIEVPVRFQLVE